MGLVEKRFIISQMSPPLDRLLATQLVDEFISMERRYIQRDWEPTELDGGHFCEALARILYHQDSGNLELAKLFNDCLCYIEKSSNPHTISRQNANHLVRVIRTIYKFRNERGVAHISAVYSPNQMDAKFLIESVRWAFAETLRMFWSGDRDQVAKTIRELLQFDVPCIGVFDDVILVQRTDLKADEEILVLLHYAGENGFNRNEIGKYVKFKASTVTESLQKLCSPVYREITQLKNGNYRLTDLGSKRIREQLAERLLLQ
jgi:hypothetical protein